MYICTNLFISVMEKRNYSVWLRILRRKKDTIFLWGGLIVILILIALALYSVSDSVKLLEDPSNAK